MRTIYIVLTKYTDTVSRVVYFLGGFGYTHASISLDETGEEMYSFNYKGFCIETATKHRDRGVQKSISFQLRVSENVYQWLQTAISKFKANKNQFSYSRLGLVCCFLRIPHKRKSHYFCSQFVAEMLGQSNAIRLKRNPSLYLPNHFIRELTQSSLVHKINYNAI